MEIKDSGRVILTAYHSYTPSRIPMEQSFVPQLSPTPGHSPLNSKARYQRMDRMISQDLLHPPSFSRSVSQESLDSTSMADYWSEVKSIEESAENGQEEHAVLEVKSADEGEMEEAWIQEAGLSTLVSGSLGEEPAEALFSTLTRTQAAVVKKRIDNYTQTQRKKKHSVRDVRDIFAVGDSPPVFCPGAGSPNSIQLSSKLSFRAPGRLESCASDCKLSKDSPSLLEELNFEVPYSECALRKDCRSIQRIKKDDATLPFLIRKAKLGLTIVGDLSKEDMKKIGYISLIELTAYFDALGIELKRNRTVKSKVRECGLFGVPLTTLLENDQKKFPGSKVPLIFKKLLSKLEQTGLQTEGILRVPGSASRVKNLRQELEAKFYEDTFDWEQVRHNDAAGLLKMFIRELPYPLLTVEYLPAFNAVENISPSKLQLQALHLLIMLLPEPNRDTLKAFLEFLSKVVANEEKNRMSLWNVSMIAAPNLFMCKGKTANPQEMQGAAGAAHVVRLLVKYQDILWTVPYFMISHVRKMNEAAMNKKHQASDKSKKKLLRTFWNPEREKTERSELCDVPRGVIRVHAPQHAKVSMAIQLDNETKAMDVIARFDCENSSGSLGSVRRQKQYLYEVGGNIGERCLDPETYLLDLYHVNPQCQWILKPRTT
ncbi:rho GTPase-activating protein 28-like isoform X2 [Acipenser ruthenus]|uniref:rho GTPase-activating protein 28-like isoform X2 n=1 Tax=Acipenser ruthenus TaxID=7906 RepID=UPI002741B190|nr:rho GTPase-activating protein 28-like isoform X2 [Acipenser ruthenus]